MQSTSIESSDTIAHSTLLVVPPSLRQRYIITDYLARITQRFARHPSIVAGHTPDLPLVVTAGPAHCRLAVDVVGNTQSLPRAAYDAVGVATEIMSLAMAQIQNIQSILSSPVCLISDEWLNRADLLHLSIEMFLAGVMAGDLSRGRALVYREQQPRLIQKRRGGYL